ncbi:MAG: hypothetical protein IBX62_02680 [Coriobacteriia bacterium]|nr:hypothetical protein [Coriobacteriia bacterium]
MSVLETEAKPVGSGGGDGGDRTRVATGAEPPEGRHRGALRALARAVPWAVGAALGVAAGAYLTAVGGAGAPGASALDAWVDLVALPALAFAAMLAAHLLLQGAAALIRRLRPPRGGA